MGLSILFIAPRYYPHVGGVEYVVKSLAEKLAAHGNEVTVLAGEPGADAPSEEVVHGVRVIRWPTWAPGGAYHIPLGRGALEGKLRELLTGIDVVHVHNAHAVFPVYTALRALRLHRGALYVFTMHFHARGHTLLREAAWRIFWARYVSKLVRSVDAIQAVSRVEAQRIVARYPDAKGKLTVIPNGVDDDVRRYNWSPRGEYMVYAGRLERYKRLELAVDLAASMGLRLLLIGRGDAAKRIARYASKRCGDCLEILEPQPRAEYLRILSEADYAVNPSLHEAFSIFIAEALSIGVPSIVSNVIAEALGARPVKQVIVKGSPLQLLDPGSVKVRTWSEVARLMEGFYRGIRERGSPR